MFTEDRPTRLQKFVDQVYKQLIVSCQALPDEALFGSDIMAKMATAAAQGGARAIRANTPVDVKAIKEKVNLPVIGLFKEVLPDYPVIITPTLAHAKAIAEVGADIIAIDGTNRPHPEGDLAGYIARIHEATDCLIMADISNLQEALEAEKAGADMVSSTLSGYTPYTPKLEGPDLDLVKQLAEHLSIPVIGEGRYHTPEQVKQALANGATAVVVGGAITRPKEITMRYVKVINS
ncbi:MAG: N-acetylmannosamine-6-phosphate 2-epimerase [Anaerolineaceae bacterium]